MANCCFGAIFGATFAVIKKFMPSVAKYTLGMAFSAAFIVHGYYSIAMFVGSLVLVVEEQSQINTVMCICGILWTDTGEVLKVLSMQLSLLGF